MARHIAPKRLQGRKSFQNSILITIATKFLQKAFRSIFNKYSQKWIHQDKFVFEFEAKKLHPLSKLLNHQPNAITIALKLYQYPPLRCNNNHVTLIKRKQTKHSNSFVFSHLTSWTVMKNNKSLPESVFINVASKQAIYTYKEI